MSGCGRLTGRGVLERYGMTETLMNTAVRADGEPGPGTVGEPVSGVERAPGRRRRRVRSMSPTTRRWARSRSAGRTCSWATSGVREATAEAMRDGWFGTGDMATRDERGYIRIVGRRATDLIKSGGYKIGAGEIEAALREHPAVDDAAVTGEADADLGERVRLGRAAPRRRTPSDAASWSTTSPTSWPPTSGRARVISWTSCRATSWARSRSSDWRQTEVRALVDAGAAERGARRAHTLAPTNCSRSAVFLNLPVAVRGISSTNS